RVFFLYRRGLCSEIRRGFTDIPPTQHIELFIDSRRTILQACDRDERHRMEQPSGRPADRGAT
ncbi:MAG TPA: hypothetical protein VFZ73_10235, partial [Gemmatimonadaceae bacterium]